MSSRSLPNNESFRLPLGPIITTLLLLCNILAVTDGAVRRTADSRVDAIPEAERPWRPRQVNVHPELFSPSFENIMNQEYRLSGPITYVETTPLINPVWVDGRQVPSQETRRVELLHAKITTDNLGAGGFAEYANRQFTKGLLARGAEGFEAGHIIARNLGGPGANYNFIPQYYRTNMAQLNVENRIRDHVKRMGEISIGHITELRVRLLYNGGQTGYPYAIVMNINDAAFVDENGRKGPTTYYIPNLPGEDAILEVHRAGYDADFELFQNNWVDDDYCL